MLILGVESSCDDMAAAVVRDGNIILSSVVSSQDEIHKKYGGIVPELASRRHLETVIPVIDEALKQADTVLEDIDAIGVTKGPGLVGSILVGLSFAKAIAYVRDIPFVGVNHIEAHTMAVFLEKKSGVRSQESGVSADTPNSELSEGVRMTLRSPSDRTPNFPFISLVVSGGHTSLFKFRDFGDYEILGQTRDDAAGEAFDKIAKKLGLGYPGGAIIDKLAKNGNPSAIGFTRPYISKDVYDFSFSGLKTAALKYIPDAPHVSINDLAASFQEAVVDVLVDKAISACKTYNINELVVSGGVACNSRLREKLYERAGENDIKLFIPEPGLCSDNAAMVACLAYQLLKKGNRGGLDMNAVPNL